MGTHGDLKIHGRKCWLSAVGLLVLVGTVTYCGSFDGPFVFDGKLHIAQNEELHRQPLRYLRHSTRPVSFLTFALNAAVGRQDPWGFHLVNLIIHLASTIVLFEIARQTLSHGRPGQRYGPQALLLAFAIAALWMVHPLQTQSVTYIYQRQESLAGLLYLLTLLGFVKSQQTKHAAWLVVSVVSCWLGIGAKETVATAPLVVLCYDRAFAASSWGQLLRARWKYYLALIGSWPILAAVILENAAGYKEGGIFVVKEVSALDYALSQPGVILHYLRLALWPANQCLDYQWPVAHGFAEIVLPLLTLTAMIVVFVVLAFRWPELGFLACWFFLILAPTSSVVPIVDLAYEHRMYLSLAAVVALAVLAAYELGAALGRLAAIPQPVLGFVYLLSLIVAVTALGTTTFVRNKVYDSEISLWQDSVAKSPGSWRGYANLGIAYAELHQHLLALPCYRRSIALRPDIPATWTALGSSLRALHRYREAIPAHQEALRQDPGDVDAHLQLAMTLEQSGALKEAVSAYRQVLALDPHHWRAWTNLGIVYSNQSAFLQAADCFRRATALNREANKAWNGLGKSLMFLGSPGEAVQAFQTAIVNKPDDVDAYFNLAIAYEQLGELGRAARAYQQVLRLNPGDTQTQRFLAELEARRGQ